MNVLCVTGHSDRPEAETIIGLKRLGVDIHVFCPDSAPHYRRLCDAGVSVHPLRLKGRADLKAIRTIRGHLIEKKTDILHLFNNRAVSNGLLASRRLPVKIIAYRGIVGNVGFFNPASWMTYLNPRVDRIICVAEAVRQYFLDMKFLWKHIPAEKPITVYKGHHLSWYQAKPGDLSSFGISPADFVVGCTANYRPRKGIEVLVDSMDHLPEALPIHLMLIGHMKAPKLLDRIRRNQHADRIHLAGYRSDSPALQAACDTVVLPALRREGLPKVIIEAMAYAIPPIVTDSGGSPELIENTRSGLIVQPGKPQEIARAILTLYEDKKSRIKMGKEARKRLATCFNIETTIEQTMKVYENCLNR